MHKCADNAVINTQYLIDCYRWTFVSVTIRLVAAVDIFLVATIAEPNPRSAYNHLWSQ